LPADDPRHAAGRRVPHWTLLRCTNLIERFNRELRRRFDSAGAMQSELEVSKLVWSVSQAQQARWQRAWKPRGTLKVYQTVNV
jgi:transposase-like protein